MPASVNAARRSRAGSRSRGWNPTSTRPRSRFRPAGPRGPPATWLGVGAVEHGELDAGGAGDDLGSQRGSAHAAEHDVVDALGPQLVAQSQMSATSGRETATASTQPRRLPASSSASGPHSVGSSAVMPGGDEVATSCGTMLLDGLLRGAGGGELKLIVGRPPSVQRPGRRRVQQFVPADDELLDALVLEQRGRRRRRRCPGRRARRARRCASA